MKALLMNWAMTFANQNKRTRLLLVLFHAAALTSAGCASTIQNRSPVGEPFPSVVGEDLEGNVRKLPGEFSGRPLLVLIGYKQRAQFDIDRWLIGVMQKSLAVDVVELPTIAGMIPGLFAGSIDNGMRGGIPNEEWATVVTLYGDDADEILKFTGNEGPNNARVVLLDGMAKVLWFHDRGFSPRFLFQLAEVLATKQDP